MGRPTVLKVDIVTDSKGVGPGIDDADRKLSGFGANVRRHSTAIAGGLLALGAGAVAFGKSSVSAFTEAEQSAARLDDAYKRFPATNDVTRKSFDDLNASLAKKTQYDDDATASGQAVLAQYKLTGTQLQELTPLLQDYAARTGKELPDAANTLGKALLGKGKALADVGIKFKDAGSVQANYTQLMGGLRTQVGGFAEKEGKTAAGQAKILGNQFGEVQETVGSKLVPVLTKLAGGLLTTIDYVQRNSKVIGPLVAVVGALVGVVVAVNTAARAYAATQAALNIIMSANPIGLVVIAIAALVAGVVLAYKHSETFRGAVDKLWALLKRLVGFTPFGAIITHLDQIIDKVKAVGSAIKNSPIGKLAGGIGGLFSAPVLGMVSPVSGGVGGLGPQVGRLATAGLGDVEFGAYGAGFGAGGGFVIVDRRTIDARVFVDGAIDPVGVARQLQQIQHDQAARLGRATAFSTGARP